MEGGGCSGCVGSRLAGWGPGSDLGLSSTGDPSAKALPPACPVWEAATARPGRIWLLFLWLTRGEVLYFRHGAQCTAHGRPRTGTYKQWRWEWGGAGPPG